MPESVKPVMANLFEPEDDTGEFPTVVAPEPPASGPEPDAPNGSLFGIPPSQSDISALKR